VKKLSIEPGCITCGMCEFIAPKVFEVTNISHIKPDFDQAENNELIEQSVKECPVFVIKYEEQK
jgi:ferredoxin